MSRGRKIITKAIHERGFTGEVKLYFWHNDGWYGTCDQFEHEWLGQHDKHSVEQIKQGMLDKYLNNPLSV